MNPQRSLFFDPLTARTWHPPALPSLSGISDVDLDTETTGLNWHEKDRPIGISLAWGDLSAYFPWGHRGGNLPEAMVKSWAQRELRDKRIHGFNIKFDAHMLYAWGIDLEAQGCTLHDVSLSAALLDDHMTKFSLEDIAQSYLGEGKVKGIDVTSLMDMHAGDVAPYACKDVELVRRLRHKMRPLLIEQDLLEVQALEDSTIFAVCEMERNAAPLDMDLLRMWVRESEREVMRLILEIRDDTGVVIRPERPSDFEKVFNSLKIDLVHRTPAGAFSFTDEILAMYDHPVIKKMRYARQLSSLRSKYILSYAEAVRSDDTLGYNLHQLRGDREEGGAGGTITGRFSASNKNIQQVMAVEKQRERFGDHYIIRELFVPREGLILSADAAQIEYRIFGHHSGSKKILDAYAKDPGVSFHQVVWDMVKPLKPDIPYKSVKNLNFAKLYGAGIAKIADMLKVSEEETREFVTAYDTAFPEVRALLRKAATLAEERGYVLTLSKRRSRFVKGCACPACSYRGPRFHKALNSVIQGSAADIMKKKLVELHAERKHTGFTMRMTVHDEVVGDVPDLEAAGRVHEILNRQSYPQLKVPILWETAVGKNWAAVKKLKDQFAGTVNDLTRGNRSRPEA